MKLSDLGLLSLFWGIAAFVANRLYVIVRYREINVRGTVYSRAGTPVMYWVQIALLASALILTGGIALLMTLHVTDVFA